MYKLSSYITERYTPTIRIVCVMKCETRQPSIDTLKSLSRQTVIPSSIAVETDLQVSREIREYASLHPYDTVRFRETDANTLIIYVENGRVYDPDYVKRIYEKKWQNI